LVGLTEQGHAAIVQLLLQIYSLELAALRTNSALDQAAIAGENSAIRLS